MAPIVGARRPRGHRFRGPVGRCGRMGAWDDARPTAPAPARGEWSPWRSVVAFGMVSLAADMVYEGMRSVAGPFLGSLGASALTVGLVTGAGEAVALGLRLVSGPWADRSG